MNKSNPTYKIMIAGGGTGGHLFVGIAIAKALEKILSPQHVEIIFVGAKGKIETRIIPEEGYELKTLSIVGLPRNKNIFKLFAFAFVTLKSLFFVKKWIKQIKPNAIVGVGGYASFPALYMGQRMKIPNFIHEQNAYAGVVNKMLASRCTAFLSGFEKMINLPNIPTIHTGNPVRKEIHEVSLINPADARKHFQLKENIPTLLVFGGSQGAKAINEAVIKIIPQIEEHGIQLIWQTGEKMYETISEDIKKYSDSIKVFHFIKNMSQAYAACDIVVARSGASTVAELCIIGKPSILIPLPTAAENHQNFNAKTLSDKGAAILLPEQNLEHHFWLEINTLLQNKPKRNKMSEQLTQLAIRDADQKIARVILKKINAL